MYDTSRTWWVDLCVFNLNHFQFKLELTFVYVDNEAPKIKLTSKPLLHQDVILVMIFWYFHQLMCKWKNGNLDHLLAFMYLLPVFFKPNVSSVFLGDNFLKYVSNCLSLTDCNSVKL